MVAGVEQRRVLAEMGIDVWVRRSASVPAAAVEAESPPAPLPDRQLEPGTSADEAAVAPNAAEGTGERFKVHSVSLNGVFAIAEMASPEDQRLVGDVVKAVSGFVAANPESYVFEWPQQAQVTDLGAAQRAFGAFLKARAEVSTPTWIILFGDRPIRLLFGPDAPPDTMPETYLGAGLSCVDPVTILRRNPERKRVLWQAVSNRPRR